MDAPKKILSRPYMAEFAGNRMNFILSLTRLSFLNSGPVMTRHKKGGNPMITALWRAETEI